VSDTIISISDLTYRWNPKLSPVIDIKDLTILRGEKVFIYGPSGSGKTTLLGLFGGVLTQDSGSLTINGKDLKSLSGGMRDQYRADHIGFIFQQFNLIPYLDVMENVLLPLRFSKAKQSANSNNVHQAQSLLGHLGIQESHFKKKVFELSVGQQQRVAAARALIGSPKLVIADEPTSALDADLRDKFVSILEELVTSSGSTLVFVSHDHSLSKLFDRKIDLPALNQSAR
jgi:putative ABC transport system ATP-binding protein